MTTASLLKTFFPILANYIFFQTIQQIDLVMIAPFGEPYLAAHGIPAKVMLIDAIICISVAPAFSLNISRASHHLKDAQREAESVLGFSLITGLLCALIGWFFYPLLISVIGADIAIGSIAVLGLRWLLLSVPFRMIFFSSNMLIHGLGGGTKLTILMATSLIIKVLLNWLFAYVLDWGFNGIYAATVVISIFNCVIALWLLQKILGSSSLFRYPTWAWVKNLWGYISPEFLRNSSGRITITVTLFLVAQGMNASARLGVYSVAFELLLYLSLPALAITSAVAIRVAAEQKSRTFFETVFSIKWFILLGSLFSIVIGLIFLINQKLLGAKIYHFSGISLDWWLPFCSLLPFFLVIKFFDSCLRGVLQAQEGFHYLAKIDVCVMWLLQIPIVALSIWITSPLLLWSSQIIAPLVSTLGMLHKNRARIFQLQRTNAIVDPIIRTAI